MVKPAKLKIGLILDTSLDPNDGVQQYVVNIGEWLSCQGHDVHYLVGETKKRQLPNIHSLSRNIKVNFNGNNTTIPLPAGKQKLTRLIQQERFDVLHVQTPHHPFMAQRLILAAGPETAVVGTFHILPYGWSSRLGNQILGLWLKPSLKRIDRLLAVSPAAALFSERTFKIKAEVLPNVVDLDKFAKFAKTKKNRDILFFGRLVKRKGAKEAIKAFRILHQYDKKAHLTIAGAGPEQASLVDLAKELSLQDYVEFLGFIDERDKPKLLASARIVCFPSLGGESFGIVLLEAMAAGAGVVIGGDNPGYRSVLGERELQLFDPTNPLAFAGKLSELLDNKEICKELHAWQQQEVKKYDVNIVGPKLLEIYNEAIAKRRAKRHN